MGDTDYIESLGTAGCADYISKADKWISLHGQQSYAYEPAYAPAS